MTRYECPECGEIFTSDGWCPECGCGLVAILVDEPYPFELDPLKENPNKDD